MQYEKEANQVVKEILKSLKSLKNFKDPYTKKLVDFWQIKFFSKEILAEKKAFFEDKIRWGGNAIVVLPLPKILEGTLESILFQLSPGKKASFFKINQIMTVGGKAMLDEELSVTAEYNGLVVNTLNQILKKTSSWKFKVYRTILHELEHIQQDKGKRKLKAEMGKTVMFTAQQIDLSKYYPDFRYFLRSEEVEAFIVGMYGEAKKRRISAKTVFSEFLYEQEERIRRIMSVSSYLIENKIPEELKNLVEHEEKIIKYIERSFYELKKLLVVLKTIEIEKNQEKLDDQITHMSRMLKGGIFSGEERVERKFARNENKVEKEFTSLIDEISSHINDFLKNDKEFMTGSIRKVKGLLNEIKPYNAQLIKLCSRGGEIEKSLDKVESKEDLHIIRGELTEAIKDVKAFQVIVTSLIDELHDIKIKFKRYDHKIAEGYHDENFLPLKQQVAKMKEVYLDYAKKRFPKVEWE